MKGVRISAQNNKKLLKKKLKKNAIFAKLKK